MTAGGAGVAGMLARRRGLAGGDRAAGPAGVLVLAPAVVMLLAAPGAGHPHDGRADWLVPPLIQAAGYIYLGAGPATGWAHGHGAPAPGWAGRAGC